jgi:hypothetical protein
MTTCCWRSYDCDIIMYGQRKYENCPCCNCLVKNLCSSICEDFNKYYESIFHFSHEEYKPK